jgi:hypothetical protein
MQGTRKENALLFYVVVAPEPRRELQKSGRFCVESSVHFVTLDLSLFSPLSLFSLSSLLSPFPVQAQRSANPDPGKHCRLGLA